MHEQIREEKVKRVCWLLLECLLKRSGLKCINRGAPIMGRNVQDPKLKRDCCMVQNYIAGRCHVHACVELRARAH